ncbi:PREDICTED: uncharacterized protein LOC109173825 [Ipomoea nil]|uniref:uncharacterized protein LOC109173825 n=1 Tax=Ipomoea nil TaxID=35883 RepID=UPI000901A508|nr:PREDICTED: uncharacterized protein LOC109173825 [Ipomoea nil]
MASVCVSSCVKDARAPVVVRATYENLYKWPESDAEFIRSVTCTVRSAAAAGHPRVVDSISCRQLYLRSYTFSREEDGRNRAEEEEEEETAMCCGRARKEAAGRKKTSGDGGGGGGGHGRRKKKCFRFRRAMASIFRRLLSCTAQVDVVG